MLYGVHDQPIPLISRYFKPQMALMLQLKKKKTLACYVKRKIKGCLFIYHIPNQCCHAGTVPV